MATPLYRQAFRDLITAHEQLFADFKEVHDKFRKDQDTWKSDFDRIGKDVLKIIEETENRLCSKMENSNRGKFSNTLSDKFRAEVRAYFPLIDLVGVTIS
jgi:hypothetical protein